MEPGCRQSQFSEHYYTGDARLEEIRLAGNNIWSKSRKLVQGWILASVHTKNQAELAWSEVNARPDKTNGLPEKLNLYWELEEQYYPHFLKALQEGPEH